MAAVSELLVFGKVFYYMKLPHEPFMSNGPYQRHATTLVARRRDHIESQLNSMDHEFIGISKYWYFASIALYLLLLIYTSFIVSGLITVAFIGIVNLLFGFIVKPKDPTYGSWSVSCQTRRFEKGGKVQFFCRRHYNGVLVEEKVLD